MRNIVILSALNSELKLLKRIASDMKELDKSNGIKFSECRLPGVRGNIVTGSFGMGKVLAAMACQYAIDHYSPDKVLLVGACGGFSKAIKKGDILISNKSVQADMNLLSTGKMLGVYQGPDEINRQRFTNHDMEVVETSSSINPHLEKVLGRKPELRIGIIASHDKIECDKTIVKQIYNEFKSSGIDMETASCAIVCNCNDIPFSSIKSVFDLDGLFDQTDYVNNIEIYHRNALRVIVEILKLLYQV